MVKVRINSRKCIFVRRPSALSALEFCVPPRKNETEIFECVKSWKGKVGGRTQCRFLRTVKCSSAKRCIKERTQKRKPYVTHLGVAGEARCYSECERSIDRIERFSSQIGAFPPLPFNTDRVVCCSPSISLPNSVVKVIQEKQGGGNSS